jgi:hypothetical protein
LVVLEGVYSLCLEVPLVLGIEPKATTLNHAFEAFTVDFTEFEINLEIASSK